MRTLPRLLLAIMLLTTSLVGAERRLCLIGDATHYGWSKDFASPMRADASNPSLFYYDAWLGVGSFKFILENTDDSWLPTWNRSDDATIVKRTSSSAPDNAFSIAVAGNYSITVDTTNLTISIVAMTEPTPITFNTLFMVGDATPNGWTITDATELTRSAVNPFEFRYSGAMNVGEFKLPVNRFQNWGQECFMMASNTLMVLQAAPDSKWTIASAGNYEIVANTQTLAISIAAQTPTVLASSADAQIALRASLVRSTLALDGLSVGDYGIFTLNGQALRSGRMTDGTIDVASLNSGLYLLKVGGRVFKFVKQ